MKTPELPDTASDTMDMCPYDVSIIRELFCIATLAYEPSEDIKQNVEVCLASSTYNTRAKNENLTYLMDRVPSARILSFIDDEPSGLQCALTLCHTRKRICLVFRGTESLTDVIRDLMICKVALDDTKSVHGGFLSVLLRPPYQEISDRFVATAKEHPGYQLYTTGHSLGGALATLAAYLFVHETCLERIIKVASFGSPRVGNRAWQQSFDEHRDLVHMRVTNRHDMITTLPYIGYYHTGHQIHLNEDQIFYIGAADPLCCMCVNRPSLQDHLCVSYRKSLFPQ